MKRYILAATAAAAAAFAATPASAVNYVGSTQGCFGAGCTPSGLGANEGGIGGLTFVNGSFNQSDSNGFLSLGGTIDNLGTLTLFGNNANYNGDLFTLMVSFTAPPGTTPGSGLISAMLTGSVSSLNNGGVFFDFDNTPLLFNSSAGPFTLTVNDVSVSAGGVAQQISGQIRAVPEPATWAMMLLGFGGIGFAMRRRRQPALAQVA